jgi:hypothetical protein
MFYKGRNEVIYDEYLEIDNIEVLHPLSGPCIVNPQSQFIIQDEAYPNTVNVTLNLYFVFSKNHNDFNPSKRVTISIYVCEEEYLTNWFHTPVTLL